MEVGNEGFKILIIEVVFNELFLPFLPSVPW